MRSIHRSDAARLAGHPVDRRTFVLGTAALVLGVTPVRSLLAATQEGRLDLRLRDPSRLQGAAGERLRQGLLRDLRVVAEGFREAPAVMLACVRIQGGRPADSFMSPRFSVRTGEQALPGDQYLPGDQFLPGDQYLPGDQFLPGDQYLPATNPERFLAQVAMDELSRRRETGGIFLALVVEDPRLRERTASAGAVLPLRS